MENSLWFGRYILAFAKALENHSHLTRSGMMLFLKSGGIAKSSVHLQMCPSHSRNTVYLNVWSPVKLHTEKLHWRNAGNVVPTDIHSYKFYFLPWSSFILIRSKIPFISLEDCFTSLPLRERKISLQGTLFSVNWQCTRDYVSINFSFPLRFHPFYSLQTPSSSHSVLVRNSDSAPRITCFVWYRISSR